jgi:1-acyl-sn-glycerol-3-phosphate acyltransferase
VRNKTKIIGKENLMKRSWGVITFSNHESFMDSLPIRASMLTLGDVFFRQNLIPYDVPDFDNFYSKKVSAFFMDLLRNIPVKRHTGSKDVKNELVEKCSVALKNMNCHLFFEGGRTVTEIRPCVTGVAELILKLSEENFELITQPIFIDGMKNIMPRSIGQKYYKITCGKNLLIIIGKPIDFSDISKGDFSRAEKIHLIKERVKKSVVDLKPKALET